MAKYSIGIDISKADFHACLSLIDDTQRVKVVRSSTFINKPAGFAALSLWVAQSCKEAVKVPVVFVMEATGVYYENCALYLYSQGCAVSVVLPNKAKKYIGALGVKSKNDKADAKAVSRMGAEQCLELWGPAGSYFYGLRSLTRFYQGLQESLTHYTNQLEAVTHCMQPHKDIADGLEDLINTTKSHIEKTRKAISTHIATDAAMAAKIEQLCFIKGVGELSVAVIVAETNGFTLFKSISQLISYAGYDVVENQSGKRVGKTKISKKGNSRLRRALHIPALNVVRYEAGIFKTFFDRTYGRHGIKMKSYVAVQKKLLGILYALWKKGESFDTGYIQTEKGADAFSEAGFAEAWKKVSPAKGKAKQDIQTSKIAACIL